MEMGKDRRVGGMRAMKNKKIISAAACALILLAVVAVKPVMAYFTDYSVAAGSVPVVIKDTPSGVDETFDSWVKHVTITNSETGYECYVRVAAIASDKYELKMGPNTEEGWSYGDDGYYYYDKIVPAGGSTTQLDIVISGAEEDDFNVIIVHEATKVLYDKDGNPYADWSTVISGEEDGE